MTDLDTRIRTYASRSATTEDAPPDFDAAFERAVLAPRRHTAWVWSGLAAACVVALAVIVSLASSGSRGAPGPSGPAAAPSVSPSVTTPEQSLVRDRRSAAMSMAQSARLAAEAAHLRQIALDEATSAGDPNASATAVRTTRQKALGAIDAGTGGPDDEVWLIQLTGRFAVANSGPPGSDHTSRGRYLTLVLKAAAPYEQTDFGLGDDAADLTTLGTVVTLLP